MHKINCNCAESQDDVHVLLIIQDELGLSRELMFKLPLEKRWELYLSKQKVRTGLFTC